ncbi:MAG TPA: protein translocase subunit SecF [Actinomycetes bacterium]|nr:protein translocase subunit SecF [Actinomycetes bacterium]
MSSLASRLYHGETSIDFVGQWRRWLLVSSVAMLVSVVALFVPGLKFGIDFKGGAVFRARAAKPVTVAQVREAVGPSVAKVVQVTRDNPRQVIVQTESLPQDHVAKVRSDLSRVTGDPQVSAAVVGSKWGSTVSTKALIALFVFLGVIIVYVSFRFEFKMAVAALVALVHDLVITAGVYALARFEVTPATVIGLLTILGYSLYDTVVVFDKVRENTGALTSMSRVTYSDAANRAVNQTLIRSLNTSLATLLPIAALLFVGAFLLGAETIKDLALALFVGVACGTYSSIFVATPFLAVWKETEPRYRQLKARVARQPAAAAAAAGALADGGGRSKPAAARPAAGARRAAKPRVAEPVTEQRLPDLPPDPDEPDGLEPELEPVDDEVAPVAAAPPKPRPAQKPRPSQQRRKQPSRPAKRRRR